ncbi:MAG: ribonuclease R [gamma proteobacterium symbiont of Bathyaustriella thionipta]|nr:ribonuclease R [gamma proteobacterium symbiont of Bathyaustriella thionipta]
MTGKKKKSKKHSDPFLERERKNYENPIPSREFILQVLEEKGKPLTFEPLFKALGLSGDEHEIALDRRLRAMTRDGQLLYNRRQQYCAVDKSDLIAGRVIGHADGFGFLHRDCGGDDLFLSPRQMRALFDGDRALVQIIGLDRRGREEAAVVEILQRNTQQVVGRLDIEKGVGFVTPEKKRLHQEIVIPPESLNGAEQGDIVTTKIVEQPDNKRHRPVGEVVEVLGAHMQADMAVGIAIRSHDIPAEWPEAVIEETVLIPDEVPKKAIEGRTDLRTLPLVTIDGEDARDFDDAVYCKRTAKGWRLLVCIADVSAYVQPGSELDKEAIKRSTSVYFPDRVIPMLPEKLSNGLCSLNPKVDRLCMTADLQFDAEGNLKRSKFYQAVMRSQARLTYTEVGAIIEDSDAGLCEKYADLLPALYDLNALYEILLQARQQRGAIDFDTVETRIIFNKDGSIDDIVPLQRNSAHRIIEECMLAANVATAKFLLRRKIPALFRNHEGPQAERLADLRSFLAEFGLTLEGGDKPKAGDYARMLAKVAERPEAHLIQTVMLLSLSQAMYEPVNKGHFGLAYDGYTHFTSPIRRYPDLLVHRAIKHAIAGGSKKDYRYSEADMLQFGEQCSTHERRADLATRDVMDWLKVDYMQHKVGEQFQGTITSVNSFGLFVELDDVYVDGLVHISALQSDYYHFDPVGHRLVGERSGQTFRLGDRMRVTLAAVNLDDKKIDFVPADAPKGKKRSKKRRKKRK